MTQILEMVGVLVVLLLVLRFSLGRRTRRFDLRGGLTGLNVVTGALAGAVAAMLLAGLDRGGTLPRTFEASGYAPLAEAVLTVLPLAGAALGGILGYLLFGNLWRRLLVDGSATARTWLRRSQFTLCLLAFVFLARRLLG